MQRCTKHLPDIDHGDISQEGHVCTLHGTTREEHIVEMLRKQYSELEVRHRVGIFNFWALGAGIKGSLYDTTSKLVGLW